MTLSVAIRHQLGALTMDVAFESQGGLTAIFGSSGSGKTSVINVIAGLIQPRFARIILDDLVLEDTERNISVPVHKRRIGYVFQEARLFPHLTVAQNLAFGRWFSPEAERYAKRDQVIDLLGLGSLLQRKPAGLSGGEKQRVAIGRALLASPRLLLMDEPLASLDQPRKAEIMPFIERLRDELHIPILYVSHSINEVMRLANTVAVLNAGKLVAFGPAAEVAQHLDLLQSEDGDEGGTLLTMQIASYDAGFDMTELKSANGSARVPGHIGKPGEAMRIRIRSRDVMLATERPKHISALNIFSGNIAAMDNVGTSGMAVKIDCGGDIIQSRITRASAAALGLAMGQKAYAIVKAVSVASATRV